MNGPSPHPPCRECGREIEGKLDPHGWCAECRRRVVRRATPLAVAAAVAVAALYLAGLGRLGALASTNFLIFWLVLGALLAFGTYKVVRRIAFDVIRARAARSNPG